MTVRNLTMGVVSSAAVGDSISIGGVVLEILDCPSCGCLYALAKNVATDQRERGGQHYCPNGHSLSWKENDLARAREELERERRRSASLTSQLDQERASHVATRGQLTKIRNRIAKGVCPCCRRSFVNVGRHMATKHPDYAKANA
jgi:hypothetical protein